MYNFICWLLEVSTQLIIIIIIIIKIDDDHCLGSKGCSPVRLHGITAQINVFPPRRNEA